MGTVTAPILFYFLINGNEIDHTINVHNAIVIFNN